jgi:MFS family permease
MEAQTKQRIALSTYFFLSGFGFATWTSRIPTIKDMLQLNEAELGSILMVMPISSLLGLPLSGFLVSKFETRFPLIIAVCLYVLALFSIGLAENVLALSISIFCVAFFMRTVNISMNTQAISLQKIIGKKINGSFHALWSMGGIVGVGCTTLMIVLDVSLFMHFVIFACMAIPIAFFAFQHLLKNDIAPSGNKLILSKPDPYIMSLGFLILFAAICEGGMFDWSGVYFNEVVKTEVFTFGFLLFMISMTISRFASDWFIHRLGIKRTFVISAMTITIGIAIAVIFPTFYMALLGFSLVGLGVAPVVPMALVQAGDSKKYSPGIAVSIISTYGTSGMLIGPPMIGYLAHAFDLRTSFIFLIIMGLAIIPVSRLFFRIKERN